MLVTLAFINPKLKAQSFQIKGKITGKDSGYITLHYFRDGLNKNVTDTFPIKKGTFYMTGTVTGCEFARLNTDPYTISKRKKYSVAFFLTPGTITISIHNGDLDKAIIKGSKPQDEYSLLKKSQEKNKDDLSRLSRSADSLRNLLMSGQLDPKIMEEQAEQINKKYRPIALLVQNQELSYIQSHPKSYVSFLLLYTYVGIISSDSINLFYNRLSNSIKGSSFDYRFLDYTARVRKAFSSEYPFDKIMLNEDAPAFAINNSQTNESINNLTLKNKVVILEFWGIYCLPCLKANPLLEQIRNEYGKEKIEIIAINDNANQDLPLLFSYLLKNPFSNWIHVFINDEVKLKNSQVFKGDFTNYNGLGIPRTVVIDRNSKVAYKNYGYSLEEMGRLKLLIEKVVQETY